MFEDCAYKSFPVKEKWKMQKMIDKNLTPLCICYPSSSYNKIVIHKSIATTGIVIFEMNIGIRPDVPIARTTWSIKKAPKPIKMPPVNLKTKFAWFRFGEMENIADIKSMAQSVSGKNKSV